MKKFIRQLFCKHEYGWYLKPEQFFNLSGETHIYVCKKCLKIKEERFVKYD